MNLDTLPRFCIDLILGFTLLEALILSMRHRLSGLGMSATDICLGLLPGFCLMLGVRFAAPVQVPVEVFVCLFAAGVAHALDFYRRFARLRALPVQT